jgi:MFS family permease
MSAVRRRARAWWDLFPPLVWTVLLGTLMTRTAFFMVWPFLAIILEREFHLSPSEVGSILGTAFLSSAFVGFYAGNVSDRFGRQPVMLAGCLSAIAAYATLAVAPSVTAYTLGAFCAGFSRAVLDAPGKAVIADYIDHQRTRDMAFHARYFLINVGGALGPLLGLAFGLSARQGTFWVTAAAYTLFAAVVLLAFRRAPERAHISGRTATSMVEAISIMKSDRQFLLLLLAMTLTMFAYAQQESTLIQHVSREGGGLAVTLVTALVVTNAVTVVIFQFPLLRALAGVDPYVRTYIGLALFAAAFVGYALLPVSDLLPWVGVTWLLSVGEVILFPTLQLQVDRMAPPDMKGSYFGAAGLSSLGFGLGPFAGGFMLQHMGGPATFSLTALAVVLGGVCCRRASHAREGIRPSRLDD